MGIFGLAVTLVSAAFAADAHLVNVEVSGDKAAEIRLRIDKSGKEQPKVTIKENVVELQFAGLSLPADRPKIDVSSPHVLLSRISLFEGDKGGVRGRIVVNGSPDRLKERFRVSREEWGVLLRLDPPEGANATLNLLQEEQKPLTEAATGEKIKAVPSSRWPEMIVPLVMLGFLGFAVYGGMKFMKRRGLVGTRKYLVEQLSYCPVGSSNKTGVCLLKVGTEFVLVGVTPQQVTLLSSVPALSEKYQQETRLERETFQEAVEVEVKKMRGSKEHSA